MYNQNFSLLDFSYKGRTNARFSVESKLVHPLKAIWGNVF